ncbi:DUF1203 domain-containing protein [Phaeobacter gallaeciensis]|uniref:DUF1203 domain-containing protein n=1 Tax=Phaeobacter gallaeciensis TaxID=60890 RepID=UPI0023804301|nr:DUF1203 domain-containing protein [Phaeobacter gallaeciensis]MDE4275819.1 DUF1203 domain-containing protein [Phaeobacter gallaeciensis]MDE4300968.1 DUF1203 domain-containing protein [Phaeobacter gallaeciensis]MDE5186132.1 DUF1203 domain-containing protein [Phaeobacter gallaeciensis]
MLTITALTTDTARALQTGGLDANGQKPERSTSDGARNPCRHCLRYIPEGAGMLILAHRPFPDPQPYAEVGPIFLCAEKCARHDGDEMPEVLQGSPDYLIKGYGQDDRIIYGTGAVVEAERMMGQAEEIFADPRIAYIHIRSARNNCYQARIDRE